MLEKGTIIKRLDRPLRFIADEQSGEVVEDEAPTHLRYPPAPRVASIFDNLLECASQYGVDVALSFRPQSPVAFGEYKEEIRIDAVIHETGTRFFQARMSTDSVRASLPGGPPALRQYLIDDIANALIQAMKEAAWR